MKTNSLLKYASILSGVIFLFWCIKAVIGYNTFIHGPMQGGWDMYRFREFAPQLLPYLSFGISVLLLTLIRMNRIIWSIAFTVFLFSGFYVLMISALVVVRLPEFRLANLGFISLAVIPLIWIIFSVIVTNKSANR